MELSLACRATAVASALTVQVLATVGFDLAAVYASFFGSTAVHRRRFLDVLKEAEGYELIIVQHESACMVWCTLTQGGWLKKVYLTDAYHWIHSMWCTWDTVLW
jgi:hypothetical protein